VVKHIEIKYPDRHCSDSPTHAHHYLVVMGSIWRCKYCWRCVSQPMSFVDTIQLSNQIKRHGIDAAYEMFISKKHKVKLFLSKMEEIRVLSHIMPPRELSLMIASIINDKQFRRLEPPEPGPHGTEWLIGMKPGRVHRLDNDNYPSV